MTTSGIEQEIKEESVVLMRQAKQNYLKSKLPKLVED